MRSLYPPLQPSHEDMLDVGHGHTIRVEQCGAADGIPVVFLHGGPGSGCKADHRQFFDPARYRVILFDQRGAGRSTPFGGTAHNTTDDLVNDMEQIRAHCGIEQWVLFGGSWGATLALAYARAHPAQVRGIILRGTFLARARDVAWFFGGGASELLPQAWHRFSTALGLAPGEDVLARLHADIFSDDAAVVERAAQAWEAWSGAVVMFSIDQAGNGAAGPIDTAVAKARIEMHYAANGYFMQENALLDGAAALPRVPTTIIHGARDLTCPAQAAFALHQALPHATLEILRTAGHLSSETPMVDALVRATDAMADALDG